MSCGKFHARGEEEKPLSAREPATAAAPSRCRAGNITTSRPRSRVQWQKQRQGNQWLAGSSMQEGLHRPPASHHPAHPRGQLPSPAPPAFPSPDPAKGSGNRLPNNGLAYRGQVSVARYGDGRRDGGYTEPVGDRDTLLAVPAGNANRGRVPSTASRRTLHPLGARECGPCSGTSRTLVSGSTAAPTEGMDVMKLESIELRDFRGISNLHLPIDEKLTVIVGDNGIGKTSILDAICYSLHAFRSIWLDKPRQPMTLVPSVK